MGLDMYLRGDKYKRTEFKRDESGELERTTDGDIIPVNVTMVDGFERKSEILSLGYWRKHAPLHHMIVNTFADGVDDIRSGLQINLADWIIKNQNFRRVQQAAGDGDSLFLSA